MYTKEMGVFKRLPLKGFEKYFVSENGFVSNGKKIMKQFSTKDGYKRICLYSSECKPKKFSVHRLVAYTFIGIPDNEKLQINHLDYKRDNNNFRNLEWVTAKQNIHHSIKNNNIDLERLRNQAKRANELSQIARRKKITIKEIETGKTLYFDSVVEMEKETNLCRKAISSVARGERKQHKGYTAEYI